jgi:hypothetical protein
MVNTKDIQTFEQFLRNVVRVVCFRSSSSVGSVDWATGWKVRGLTPGRCKRFFFSPKRRDRMCCTVSFPLNWFQVCFPGIKQKHHGLKHSPPSKTEVKNEWSYKSSWYGLIRTLTFYSPFYFVAIANNVIIFVLHYFILHSLSSELRKPFLEFFTN